MSHQKCQGTILPEPEHDLGTADLVRLSLISLELSCSKDLSFVCSPAPGPEDLLMCHHRPPGFHTWLFAALSLLLSFSKG